MSVKKRGYKKELVEKVKQKFNDLQSGGEYFTVFNAKSRNDKDRQVRHTDRVDKAAGR